MFHNSSCNFPPQGHKGNNELDNNNNGTKRGVITSLFSFEEEYRWTFHGASNSLFRSPSVRGYELLTSDRRSLFSIFSFPLNGGAGGEEGLLMTEVGPDFTPWELIFYPVQLLHSCLTFVLKFPPPPSLCNFCPCYQTEKQECAFRYNNEVYLNRYVSTIVLEIIVEEFW